MSNPGDITGLLHRADIGDKQAAEQLFRLIEPDLKVIAGRRKQGFASRADHSTTGLVDDAFCALVGNNVTTWQPGDRRKFFSYASVKIHDLLVEAARAQAAQKRGGGVPHVRLEDACPGSPDRNLALMLDLRHALEQLDEYAPLESQVFRLRYFLGCSFVELAEILELSQTRSKMLFRKAQLLLQSQLKDY